MENSDDMIQFCVKFKAQEQLDVIKQHNLFALLSLH